MHFSANAPLNTQAYAVTISDRLINFQSDGNKICIIVLRLFSYIKIMNIKELKKILKEKNIDFYTYWDKKG